MFVFKENTGFSYCFIAYVPSSFLPVSCVCLVNIKYNSIETGCAKNNFPRAFFIEEGMLLHCYRI